MVDFQRRTESQLNQIPAKANKILYLFLICLLLLVLRLWHLGIIQHEKKSDEAFRPRRKVVIETASRGTIRDRFNLVLATNRVEYRLSVIYNDMRQVPAFAFDPKLNKKRPLRREYISKLAELIATTTGLEAERTEDLIHAQASMNDSVPYILKEDLTEQEYYSLKSREKDFPGLRLERVAKRYYPRGKVASHLVGYLSSMPRDRYEKILQELRILKAYLRDVELGLPTDIPNEIHSVEEAEMKSFELEERAYTLNDSIGILGVESSFEEELRGYAGKRVYFSDAKGNCLREMPGSHIPVSGKRLCLSISAELQEFAEKLLAQSEHDREIAYHPEKGLRPEPWMRGGAIIAIDPKNGDVIAMASYPRFDPNDFMKRPITMKAMRWIENDLYVGKIWDGSLPLSREILSDASKESWKTEELKLSWKAFISFLFLPTSPYHELLQEDRPIGDLIVMQRAFDEILKRAPTASPEEVIKLIETSSRDRDMIAFQAEIAPYKSIVNSFFNKLKTPQEKLLLLDLSRLVLCHEEFSPELLAATSHIPIKDFRELTQNCMEVSDLIRKSVRTLFHEKVYKPWRKANEKEFLALKRLEEKQAKKHAKPYIEYLDKWEKSHFEAFWGKWRNILTSHIITNTQAPDELISYIQEPQKVDQRMLEKTRKLVAGIPQDLIVKLFATFKGYQDLKHPLLGRYHDLPGNLAKHLAATFTRSTSAGTMRSYAFRQSTIQGSIFKLVTAYAGLKQRYIDYNGRCTPYDLSLYELDDHTFQDNGRTFVGNFSNGKPIPQLYKGGRIPKSLNRTLGRLDLIRAIEYSSNPYFSILAGDFLRSPEYLTQAARDFGYGEKTGIALPGEISGNVPSDVAYNRTGLYATAIGQHTLVTTPLQTSTMISALANGGKVLKPNIVSLIAGSNLLYTKPKSVRKSKSWKENAWLQRLQKNQKVENHHLLSALPAVYRQGVQVRREIFLPREIRSTIFEGMRRAVGRVFNDELWLKRLGRVHPTMQHDFEKLRGQMIGKSSTSEVIEKVGFNISNPSEMYRHIWFGGIVFHPKKPTTQPNDSFIFRDNYGEPELVVIAYLRFGGYGREVAPMAGQIAQKWRELKSKYQVPAN